MKWLLGVLPTLPGTLATAWPESLSWWNLITTPVGAILLGLVFWDTRRSRRQDSSVEQTGEAVTEMIRQTEMIEDYPRLCSEVERLSTELKGMTNERDGALESLETCKRNFDLAKLRWYAQSLPLRGVPVQVKLRFATYADFPLVQEVETILKRQTHLIGATASESETPSAGR